MKNLIIFLVPIFIFLLLGCKNDAQSGKNESKIFTKDPRTDKISTLRKLYTALYGADDPVNEKKILAKYVTKDFLDKIDALRSDPGNMVLDYDPFLQGQDYDSKTMMKSLDINELKNDGDAEVSFTPLPGTKKTKILYHLIEQGKNWKIVNIVSDSIINKKNPAPLENGNYELDKSVIISNGDSYSIIVLEKNGKMNMENAHHNSNPVVIYKGNRKILENPNLIFPQNGNCPADGFQKIVSKADFFTIEQTYCKDFLFVNSYATFKIDEKGGIYLYKYGEEYTDRGDPDRELPEVVKTARDFQKIKFEDTTYDFLLGVAK